MAKVFEEWQLTPAGDRVHFNDLSLSELRTRRSQVNETLQEQRDRIGAEKNANDIDRIQESIDNAMLERDMIDKRLRELSGGLGPEMMTGQQIFNTFGDRSVLSLEEEHSVLAERISDALWLLGQEVPYEEQDSIREWLGDLRTEIKEIDHKSKELRAIRTAVNAKGRVE